MSQTTNPPSKAPPVFKYRVNDVLGSVWTREHEGKLFYNTTIVRLFHKEGEKHPRETHTFGICDLAAVCAVANECAEWIGKKLFGDVKEGN